jgi:hypothetical protein
MGAVALRGIVDNEMQCLGLHAGVQQTAGVRAVNNQLEGCRSANRSSRPRKIRPYPTLPQRNFEALLKCMCPRGIRIFQ